MTQPKAALADGKPPTVYDVAALAGVSAQTVSRLLQGFEGIRPTTRERVETAIAQLGYRPNQAARQLRTRKSYRLGGLVHEMFAYGPSRLLRGAAMAARDAGYSLSIVGVDGEDERSIEAAFDNFQEEQVAGILAVTLTDDVRSVVERRRSEIPIILDPAESRHGSTTSSEAGAQAAAQHLLALGHRKVAVVAGPSSWLPARQRQDCFIEELSAGGGTCVEVWEGDWTPASGARAAADVRLGADITAVFAANDAMAIGLMSGLARRGLSAPGDVSVVGFDDIPESEFLDVPLTTVRPPYEAEGHAAITALLAEVDGRGRPALPPLSSSLVPRASTAAV
jgi:DNA-binding LacI/PurR family transcriptional regulator